MKLKQHCKAAIPTIKNFFKEKEDTQWFPWKETSRTGKSTESGFLVVRGWGVSVHGDRASFWGDEPYRLGLDRCDGSTTLWMYLMTLNCTLKNGEFYPNYKNMYCTVSPLPPPLAASLKSEPRTIWSLLCPWWPAWGQSFSCCCFSWWVVSTPLEPHGLLWPWHSPGKKTGVGCHSLLQGIFPIQGLNSHPLYSQVDSLPLSHQGSHSHSVGIQ